MGLTSYGERRIVLSYGDLFRRPRGVRIAVRNEDGSPIFDQIKTRGRIKTGLLLAESLDDFSGGRCPLRTLVHEFVHMRCGHGLRHGKEFDRLHGAALNRVWAASR
jgi:hypothetical protein